jgi:hypothetical protein
MSYISCVGSSSIPLSLPVATNAIGYQIIPTILTSVDVADNTEALIVTPFVLPRGVWIVSGYIRVGPGTGATTMTSAAFTLLYGVAGDPAILNVGGFTLTNAAPANLFTLLPFSFTVAGTGDATDLLYIYARGDVNAGNWVINAQSKIFVTRVA